MSGTDRNVPTRSGAVRIDNCTDKGHTRHQEAATPRPNQKPLAGPASTREGQKAGTFVKQSTANPAERRCRTYEVEADHIEPWAVPHFIRLVNQMIVAASDGKLERDVSPYCTVTMRFQNIEESEHPDFTWQWAQEVDRDQQIGFGWKLVSDVPMEFSPDALAAAAVMANESHKHES